MTDKYPDDIVLNSVVSVLNVKFERALRLTEYRMFTF